MSSFKPFLIHWPYIHSIHKQSIASNPHTLFHLPSSVFYFSTAQSLPLLLLTSTYSWSRSTGHGMKSTSASVLHPFILRRSRQGLKANPTFTLFYFCPSLSVMMSSKAAVPVCVAGLAGFITVVHSSPASNQRSPLGPPRPQILKVSSSWWYKAPVMAVM